MNFAIETWGSNPLNNNDDHWSTYPIFAESISDAREFFNDLDLNDIPIIGRPHTNFIRLVEVDEYENVNGVLGIRQLVNDETIKAHESRLIREMDELDRAEDEYIRKLEGSWN